ncbi:nectin-2-like [Oryzias melastigma]|nr:nectin-2-like [Oryzias melastigma]
MSSAKPVNSASTVSVEAGTQKVTVAKCESANGLPAAKISWVTTAKGNETTTTKAGTDNTVTVTSEYRMVPTSADNGKDISCVVAHRTLEKPESFKMKLAVLFAPEVSIAGYDNNWYIGRTSTVLTCQATANPVPTSVLWKTMSGEMPDTVQISGNQLKVLKVDETVNTTFVCEVKNRLGTSKSQVTIVVRGEWDDILIKKKKKASEEMGIIWILSGAGTFEKILVPKRCLNRSLEYEKRRNFTGLMHLSYFISFFLNVCTAALCFFFLPGLSMLTC